MSYVASLDRGEPRPRHAIRDRMPAHRLALQRCRDCRALMMYGPAICSFCLSEHLESASAGGKSKAVVEGRNSAPLT